MTSAAPWARSAPGSLPDATTHARLTERVMLDWLRKHRYSGMHGNGYRWVFATHVPDAAGFDACRTADAVAMDMWASKGRELHGHEVKVSRADWLRELRQPDKAQAVAKFMDRWWLIVPDAAIVRDWGMAVVSAIGIRTVKKAPRRQAEPLRRDEDRDGRCRRWCPGVTREGRIRMTAPIVAVDTDVFRCGHPLTDEKRRASGAGVTRTCARAECARAFTVAFPSDRQRHCSRSCGVKLNATRPGARNANWRGDKTKPPLRRYMDMTGRCRRPTHHAYERYGGRGITVCERWLADFWNFVADVGERPPGRSIDRVDNNSPYGPGNFRWATDSQQVKNRRPEAWTNRRLTRDQQTGQWRSM